MSPRSKVKFGGSLGPKLRLKKAIPVKVQRRVIVSWDEAEEWGEGESLGAAMEDFGKCVRDLWELLHAGPLGPNLNEIKAKLEKYVEVRR